jgi:TRAP-type C4-dicarboxylate transport system permease small subunit
VTAAANILLCVMVVVTCIDVVGRYFFSAPLLGAHEIITLAMGIMIYLGMPLVTASREHLIVDLAGSLLNPKGKRIQQIIINSIAALTFTLFSYLLLFYGFDLAEDLMITEDLEIEQAPIAYVMAVMCFLTIFVFLYQVSCATKDKKSDYSKSAGSRP